jgi:hypothetical protein
MEVGQTIDVFEELRGLTKEEAFIKMNQLWRDIFDPFRPTISNKRDYAVVAVSTYTDDNFEHLATCEMYVYASYLEALELFKATKSKLSEYNVRISMFIINNMEYSQVIHTQSPDFNINFETKVFNLSANKLSLFEEFYEYKPMIYFKYDYFVINEQ